MLVLVEFGVCEESSYGGRGLAGRPAVAEGLRVEGVVTVVQHALGVVVGQGGGLDAEVAEHGVGFPTAEQLDGVRVNASAEEGSGAAGPEGAGADEVGVDAGCVFDGVRSVAEGIGHEARGDFVPLVVSRVEVSVKGRVSRCLIHQEVVDEVPQRLAGAPERVLCGFVADLLTTNAILLVSKF